MAGELELEVDMKLFQRAMAEAPKRFFVTMRAAMQKHHRAFTKTMKTKRIAGRKGKAGQDALSDRLSSRSGFLRRGIKSQTFGPDLNSLEVVSFSEAPYSRIHETGGEITPKSGGWLTIPLRAAKTASGIGNASARSFANTFWLKTKDPEKILLMRKTDQGVEPLFVLMKRVTIKPRFGWMKTWREQYKDLGPLFDEAAREALSPQGNAA